jgi:4a-hydroxytetrahydrobiopterin dehydratase
VFAAGAIYEGQGHHAEFTLGWGHTEAVLYTHNVNRLTQADVVLAAKFNKVCSGAG